MHYANSAPRVAKGRKRGIDRGIQKVYGLSKMQMYYPHCGHLVQRRCADGMKAERRSVERVVATVALAEASGAAGVRA